MFNYILMIALLFVFFSILVYAVNEYNHNKKLKIKKLEKHIKMLEADNELLREQLAKERRKPTSVFNLKDVLK